MEFLELVNAGLLLTVQCVAAAAQPQSGLGWGDGGICRLKAPLWLPHSAAKTWWEFPKPTFFYCQEFCSGPIFSWLRLLEGEKYWNKSHHHLSSPHCHCRWYSHCWVSLQGQHCPWTPDTRAESWWWWCFLPPPHEPGPGEDICWGGMEMDRLQRCSFLQQRTRTMWPPLSETCHKQNKSVLDIYLEN